MAQVIKSKNGLFIKEIDGFGALVYSPYSGLFFSIAENYAGETIRFLNNETVQINEEIALNLNINITNNIRSFEVNHWLPEKSEFVLDEGFPEEPIVINWLISDQCNCQCKYCYATDVMEMDHDREETTSVAKGILSYKPLAVVLSGGEPMLSQELGKALEVLGDKTGTIIDTNGLIFRKELIPLLNKYNTYIRVSLDSVLPEINNMTRPIKDETEQSIELLNTIFNNIFSYIENGISVSIQTVVTSCNKNVLEDLYKRLPQIGIKGLRLLLAVEPNNENNLNGFEEVMVQGRSKSIKEAVVDLKKKMNDLARRHSSKSEFAIQVVTSSASIKNSVILVYPSGDFYTEQINRPGKIFIDKYNSSSPKDIFKTVDLRGHYERYLGEL